MHKQAIGMLRLVLLTFSWATLASAVSSFNTTNDLAVLPRNSLPTRRAAPSIERPCTTAADCSGDTPWCEFPWFLSPAPYESVGKVCMAAPITAPCTSNEQCTTKFCSGGSCARNPDDPWMQQPCRYDPDCVEMGRCGTSADGVWQGRCFTMGSCDDGTPPCTNGGCDAFYCSAPNLDGQPCSDNGYCYSNVCGSRLYIASAELSDGSFQQSSLRLNFRTCQPVAPNVACSTDVDCPKSSCIEPNFDGVKQCALGKTVGASCSLDVECHSQRCAGDVLTGSFVCKPKGVGDACNSRSQCGSQVCDGTTCQQTTAGSPCVYNSDCPSQKCDAVLKTCTPIQATSTTTSSTTMSSFASTSTTSTTPSTTTTTTTSSTPSTTTSRTTSKSTSSSTSTSSRSTSSSTSSRFTTTTAKTTTTTTSRSTSTRSTTSTSSPRSSTSTKTTTTTTKKPTSTSSSSSTRRSTTTTTTTSTSTTTSLLPLGAVCTANARCQSAYCRAKLNADGTTRQTTSLCDVKKASGASCYQNAGCVSGTCVIARGQVNGSCK
ncbi:hypothetical protein V8E36_005231 [Tilletia maclaganii]